MRPSANGPYALFEEYTAIALLVALLTSATYIRYSSPRRNESGAHTIFHSERMRLSSTLENSRLPVSRQWKKSLLSSIVSDVDVARYVPSGARQTVGSGKLPFQTGFADTSSQNRKPHKATIHAFLMA